jgi:hypothetical protein
MTDSGFSIPLFWLPYLIPPTSLSPHSGNSRNPESFLTIPAFAGIQGGGAEITTLENEITLCEMKRSLVTQIKENRYNNINRWIQKLL